MVGNEQDLIFRRQKILEKELGDIHSQLKRKQPLLKHNNKTCKERWKIGRKRPKGISLQVRKREEC